MTPTGMTPLSRVRERALNLQLAQDAMMLEDARAMLAENRRVVREHNTLMLGLPRAPLEADDMIHVGDVHQYPSPPAAAPRQQSSSATPWVAAGIASVIAAALGGSYLGSLRGNGQTPSAPPPAEIKPATRDIDIKWRVNPETGKVETDVRPGGQP